MKPTVLQKPKNPSNQAKISPPVPPAYPLNPYNQFKSNLRQSERILENFKIITWDSNFHYTKIRTEDLDSVFVNDNPFFQEMLSLIKAYNDDVDAYEKKKEPINNGPWRSHFFVKLHNILLEVVFTNNRTLQNYFIETVHSWALDQLSRLSGLKENSTNNPKSSTNTLQRPWTGSTNLTRPDSGLQKQAPQLPTNKQGFSKRPGSAIISQGITRPVSGLIKTDRPVSGAPLQNVAKDRPESGNTVNNNANNYQYIRPLSGWTRPLSSITRPWSSTSQEIIEDREDSKEMPEGDQENFEENAEIEEVREETFEGDAEEDYLLNGNELLPSQYIKSVMKDYEIGARTKIDYVDAPYERLKLFKHKNLLRDAWVNKISQEKAAETEEQTEKPEVILYEKPELFLQQQQKYREQKEEERKQAEALKAAALAEKKLNEGGEEPAIPEKKASPFGKTQKKRRPRKKKKEFPYKANMIPDHKPFVDDDLFKVPRMETVDIHLKQKFETKSTFMHYQPSDDPRELNMELKWFYNRNKELNDKRIDEEMVTMLKQWASNKERIETEIARKIQSEYEASQFQKLEYVQNKDKNQENDDFFKEDGEESEGEDEENPEIIEKKRPFSSFVPRTHDLKDLPSQKVEKELVLYDFTGLENSKTKRKIEEVRRLLGGNINANSKEDEDKGKMPKSLSIYSTNHGIPLQKANKIRPFSAFLQSNKPVVSRNQQLFEINEIREKMAKHKTPVNTKVLMNALLVPEGMNEHNKLFKLPAPGSDLIKNPFEQVKKKRKRKGKGKKKKKF